MQISYSEYRIWHESKEQWHIQYVLGIKPKATRPMILGTIVHDGALMGGDYIAALKANAFTADFYRVAKAVVSWAGWASVPQREQKRTTINLQAKYDGLCEETHHIWELKTGKAFWTQAMADENEQITMYCLVYNKIHGVIPRATLVSANMGNGKVRVFETTRTPTQLAMLEIELDRMANYIHENGWWDKRKKYQH